MNIRNIAKTPFLVLFLSTALALQPQTQQLLSEANNLASQARAANPRPSPDQALWKQAIDKATQATKLEPQAPEPWKTLAGFYTETRFWVRAEEAWKTYLKLAPPDDQVRVQISTVYKNLAYAAYNREDFALATTYFENAADFTPNDPEPQEWLGRLYLEQGDLARSKDFWQNAVRLRPSERNRYFLAQAADMQRYGPSAVRAFAKGYDAYSTGDKSQALAYFDAAAQAAPQWVEAKRWLGRLQLELNQLAPALATWQQVAASSEATAGDRYFLRYSELGNQYGLDAAKSFLDGIAAFEGNKTAALALFQKSVQIAPQFAQAWYWLGRSAYDSKNYPLAVQAYGQAVALEPGNKEAQYWLEQARKKGQ